MNNIPIMRGVMLQKFVRPDIPKSNGRIGGRGGDDDTGGMPSHVGHVTGSSALSGECVNAGARRRRAPQLNALIIAA